MILKNMTQNDIVLTDLSVTIFAEGQTDISGIDLIYVRQSSELCSAIISKTIVLNNGIVDIDDIAIAVDYIYRSLVIINTTNAEYDISGLGISIDPLSSYSYPKAKELLRLSNEFLEGLHSGDLVLNDSVQDLSLIDSIKYLFNYSTPLINDKTFSDTDRKLMSMDVVRSKILSVDTVPITYISAVVNPLDWITQEYYVSNASNGYSTQEDGTVTGVSVSTNASAYSEIDLYINDTFNSTMCTLNTGETTYTNSGLNIDFDKGAVIKLRGGLNALLGDTRIILTVRWR